MVWCLVRKADCVRSGPCQLPVEPVLSTCATPLALGAVINSRGIVPSPVMREHAGIADDQVIMKSIGLGWPDETFPANAVVSEQKSVEEATVFVGFDN